MKIWIRVTDENDKHAINIATEVDVGKPIDVGYGYSVYSVRTTNGSTAIVESTTGAIVGWVLDKVKEDVSKSKPKAVKEQLRWAAQQAQNALMMTPEAFWKYLHR